MYNEHPTPTDQAVNDQFTREELLTDMQTIARALRQTFSTLGMINPETQEFNPNMRNLMKMLPALLSGQMADKFQFLGDLKPLLDKYQHLADQ